MRLDFKPKIDRHSIAGIVAIIILACLGGRTLFLNHASFKEAQRFLKTSPEVEKFVGIVNKTSLGLLDMGSIRNAHASYFIDVEGGSTQARALVELKNIGGCWKVLNVDLTKSDGASVKIENLTGAGNCEPHEKNN